MGPSFPRKILVAVDLAEDSGRVLDTASALARTSGATMCVMHALRDGGAAPGTEVGIATRALEHLLEGRVDQVKSVSTRVERGDPQAAILTAATALGADLIVMGTHARCGMPGPLLGSVAENVVRSASIPVMTVRGRLPRSG